MLSGAARDIERRLGRLERRVIAAAKREQVAAMTDLATVRGALVPSGKPQERMLNLFPILARHGPILLEEVRNAARAHAQDIVGSDQAVLQPVAAQDPVTGSRERTG